MSGDWVYYLIAWAAITAVDLIFRLLTKWRESRHTLDRQMRFEFHWRGNVMKSDQPLSLRDVQIFVNVLKELDDVKRKDQSDDRGGETQAG